LTCGIFEVVISAEAGTRKSSSQPEPSRVSDTSEVERSAVPLSPRSIDVLIVGAGVAGLSAAAELASARRAVTVLEARDRIGGRIFTLHPDDSASPVELGAEFVHGRPPELLRLLDDAGATLPSIEGVDACYAHGSLSRLSQHDAAFGLLEELADFARREGDMSFQQFLERRRPKAEDAERARSFVEGFNAADARRIGIAALARQQQAEDEIEGDQSSRSIHGYDILPGYLARRAEQAGARILLRSPVTSLEWKAGSVTARTGAGDAASFTATKAILTMPLGVLKARSVTFHPEPSRILSAADRMEQGSVRRLVLVFRTPFWKAKMPAMRFLFAPGTTPAVYWTQHPRETPMLVGWVGGPKADAVTNAEEFLAQALRSLEHIFSLAPQSLDAELRNWYLHDWQSDPYTLGAYSYAPVGAVDCSAEMAKPVDNTLFFAGEHTDTTGHWGTVHGALRSGLRAAQQLLGARS
jgi:monoamine oxidase